MEKGSGPTTWATSTLGWGDEMEPVKENEKEQLMREEENQKYGILGTKGQEFLQGFSSGEVIGEPGSSSVGGVVWTKS